MRHIFNKKMLEILLIILLIIINIIFRTDELAIISGAILLIIVLIVCQTSVIKDDIFHKKQLTPSPNGEKCIGNGQNKDVECMCDECDYFLECYPEWDRKK